MSNRSLLSALSVLFLLAACGDDDRGRPGVDAGPGDGGGMDAGRDAGRDAGARDAGGDDAGGEDDAGGDMDAGDLDGGMLTPSEQIEMLRAMADGTGLTFELSGVLVTYLKPAIGTEPAGFFVQAEMTGPAIFVAVDPASTTPTVDVGDELAFTVTDLDTDAMLRRVTAITGLSELSTGNDVTALRQDVSAATDLVSALDDYESERMTAAFTVVAAFAGAGTEFEAAAIDTAGITGDTNLRFRLPAALRASRNIEEGCTVSVDGVMWRFNAAAQISVFEDAFITGVTCPAPTVTSAVAASATEVVVTFDRAIDPASVMADGSQFTITDGTTPLAVTAAAASGSNVTLTTAAQTSGTTYTVTVASTVTDLLGTGVDATMNTAMFTGFMAPAPGLVINEIDYDQPGTDGAEFIELYNPGGSAFDLTNISFVHVNGSGAVPIGTAIDLGATFTSIAAGEYIVIIGSGSTVTLPSGVRSATYDAAFQNGPDGVLVYNTSTNTAVDALAYEETGATVTLDMATVDGDMYDLIEGTATTAVDSAAGSLARIPNGSDTDDAATDWQLVTTPTPGVANMP